MIARDYLVPDLFKTGSEKKGSSVYGTSAFVAEFHSETEGLDHSEKPE